MYNAKIVTDAGKTFQFGFDYGVIFDISPLCGADVSVATSQGFGQIGETVEGQSVGGIRRTIKGNVLNTDAARRMLSSLPVFTTGKLYFNESYFCNVTLEKNPALSFKSNGKIPFTMQVYCDTPFWQSTTETSFVVNGFTPVFTFPVLYDSHTFAVKSESSFTNCLNTGDVSAPMSCEFMSDADVTNYGIINTVTFEEIRFNDTLSPGQKVILYHEKGRVRAKKEAEDGSVSDFLGYLTDSSNLFSLTPGDNILKVTADTNEGSLRATVSFRAAFMGVIP